MNYVIIGNGPAGVIAAETLRKSDAYGRIILIGDEPEPPYSRMAIPYLLVGNIQENGTYLRKDGNHFAEQNINVAMLFLNDSINTQHSSEAEHNGYEDEESEEADESANEKISHVSPPGKPVELD